MFTERYNEAFAKEKSQRSARCRQSETGKPTEAFKGRVSVELRLGGTLIGGWQLSQVVQGVVEGRLGFGVVVFTGEQGASTRQLSIVHPRGAFCGGHEGENGCVLNEIFSTV